MTPDWVGGLGSLPDVPEASSEAELTLSNEVKDVLLLLTQGGAADGLDENVEAEKNLLLKQGVAAEGLDESVEVE